MRIFAEKRNYTEEEAEVLISMLPGFTGTSTRFVSAKAIENSDVFTIVNLLASDVASLDINKVEKGIPETDNVTKLVDVPAKPGSILINTSASSSV